jgi:hypothetical protein
LVRATLPPKNRNISTENETKHGYEKMRSVYIWLKIFFYIRLLKILQQLGKKCELLSCKMKDRLKKSIKTNQTNKGVYNEK